MLTTSPPVRLLAAILLACALLPMARAAGDLAEQERNKKDAVDRVVESHDFTMVLAAGRFYLKQSAIKAAQRLLGQWGRDAGLGLAWNEDAAQFQQAEAVLLDRASAVAARRFEQTTWIKETWSQYVAGQFNGEEADVIATHFQTEGGQLQRKLLDWYLGEMVMFNYAFTDRLDYNLRGSEPERLALQKAAQQRIPVEDIEFVSKYPETLNFVSRGAGLKYAKMLAIPLTGALIRHIDDVSRAIEADLSGRRAEVQPYLDAFKAR
jgi:hypothetical protein